jgi:hypothetical protein
MTRKIIEQKELYLKVWININIINKKEKQLR